MRFRISNKDNENSIPVHENCCLQMTNEEMATTGSTQSLIEQLRG